MLPFPTCPYSFLPAAHTVPSAFSINVVCPPAATSIAFSTFCTLVVPSSDTICSFACTGFSWLLVFSVPSCPYPL